MAKTITEQYDGINGNYEFEYQDCDDFSILPRDMVTQIYAVCYLVDTPEKIIIVHNSKKDTWGLIGGSVEENETYEQTLRRELHEEGNVNVIDWLPVGFQKVTNLDNGDQQYQLRCVVVGKQDEGGFDGDPAGSVDEIQIIRPDEHTQYFDWKQIGRHVFKRAEELKEKLSY